jgi:hypothetical protein
MTVDEFYQYCFNKLVEHNKNNGWVNAKFNNKYVDNELYFMVELDSYIEIEWLNPIVVYRIRQKFPNRTQIYCKVVL